MKTQKKKHARHCVLRLSSPNSKTIISNIAYKSKKKQKKTSFQVSPQIKNQSVNQLCLTKCPKQIETAYQNQPKPKSKSPTINHTSLFEQQRTIYPKTKHQNENRGALHKESEKVMAVFREYVSNRGVAMPSEGFESRRPRTCFMSIERSTTTLVDAVWVTWPPLRKRRPEGFLVIRFHFCVGGWFAFIPLKFGRPLPCFLSKSKHRGHRVFWCFLSILGPFQTLYNKHETKLPRIVLCKFCIGEFPECPDLSRV